MLTSDGPCPLRNWNLTLSQLSIYFEGGYLARNSHRIALSDQQLQDADDQSKILLSYKDYSVT